MKPINWNKLITELESSGMSQREIGDEVDLTQGAISQLKTIEGREPAYKVGARLVELHKLRVKKAA